MSAHATLHVVDRRDAAIESVERIARSHLVQVLSAASDHLAGAVHLLGHDSGTTTPRAERYGQQLAELLLSTLASEPRFREESGRFTPFVSPEIEIPGAAPAASVGCRRAIDCLRTLRVVECCDDDLEGL